MCIYLKIKPTMFIVGYYDPQGLWHCDSYYLTRADAAERVKYLNSTYTG